MVPGLLSRVVGGSLGCCLGWRGGPWVVVQGGGGVPGLLSRVVGGSLGCCPG